MNNTLITLEKKLSTLKGYEGWVIGNCEFIYSSKANDYNSDDSEAKIVKSGSSMVKIEAYNHGSSLKITLIKPTEKSKDKGNHLAGHQADKTFDMEKSMTTLSFSEEQVNSYLNEVSDYNPIHKGKEAIVPGLLMMNTILGKIITKASSDYRVNVRFYSSLKVERNAYLLKSNEEKGSEIIKLVSEDGTEFLKLTLACDSPKRINQMDNVWILGGLRSFIGVIDHMYKNIPAEVLGGEVLKELVKKYELKDSDIDFVIGGNAVGGGGNITRLAALKAGISESVPAVTLDLQCGSALEAISTAAAKIESGMAELIIAGGLESSSTQPLRMYNSNHPLYEEGKTYTVAQFVPDVQGEQVMLQGAELTAKVNNVTKAETDPWILKSHQRAQLTKEAGILNDIQVSVAGSTKDEGIRKNMSCKLIDRLPFLLKDGKSLTAANTCLMHDGAAFVVLCSDNFIKKHGIKPKAKFRLGTSIGGNPMRSPETAVLAAEKLLKKAELSYNDIDAFEVNEAFAIIDALFLRAFPGIEEKYNILGGALAYGHPYGASGAMLMIHLLKALEVKKGRYGICSVAAAGGIGNAILVEAV
jgi:acetyl-CoA C-acetyltransferase